MTNNMYARYPGVRGFVPIPEPKRERITEETMTNDNNALNAAAGICGPEKTGFDPRDPAQLDALMELANGATPGPWETGEASWNEEGDARYTLHGIKEVHAFDCQFIATSREAVPALIEEVKRLSDDNARMREALGLISRMKTMPDHSINASTLVAAHEIAIEALKAEGV